MSLVSVLLGRIADEFTSPFLAVCQLETEPLYTGLFRLNDASRTRLDEFCASLPKVLWELRSKDLAATTVRLLFPFLAFSISSLKPSI